MRRTGAILLTLCMIGGLAGCGSTTDRTAHVQSVAMLAGLTDIMQHQQFVGIVSTGKEESISKDTGRKVAKVNVKEGDIVEAGAVLFEYDAQDMKDTIETENLQLEIDRANLASEKKTLENLEKAQKKASADKQLQYSLTIREQELAIQEKEYNISKKEKEIKSLEDSVTDVQVKAPFGGRITKAGTADSAYGGSTDEEDADTGYTGYDTGTGEDDSSAFIKIVEIDNYRIKGTINEQNRGAVSEGDIMKIYSRTENGVSWSGEVSEVDYKNPQQAQTDTFTGETDEMQSTSKYTFYVDIEDLDGLIIGQHVYMRVDDGTPDPDGKIRLATGFINDIDGDAWVWAEDSANKLEKRSVTLGEYDETEDTYVIEKGLSETDYIAFPSDNLEAGMTCNENSEDAFQSGEDSQIEGLEEVAGGADEFGMEEYGGFIDDGGFGEDGDFVEDEEIFNYEDGAAGDIGEGEEFDPFEGEDFTDEGDIAGDAGGFEGAVG